MVKTIVPHLRFLTIFENNERHIVFHGHYEIWASRMDGCLALMAYRNVVVTSWVLFPLETW